MRSRPLHQRIGHAALKNVGHALAAGHLMSKDSGRTLAHGPIHFARPYGDAIAHAARHELKPEVSPIGFMQRVVEARLAIEAVEIGADELAVLHANAGIIDEIGHAARGVDLIVRAAGVRVFASMISTRSSSPFSMTTMRASRAYGEVYVTYSFIEASTSVHSDVRFTPKADISGRYTYPRATSELSNIVRARIFGHHFVRGGNHCRDSTMKRLTLTTALIAAALLLIGGPEAMRPPV